MANNLRYVYKEDNTIVLFSQGTRCEEIGPHYGDFLPCEGSPRITLTMTDDGFLSSVIFIGRDITSSVVRRGVHVDRWGRIPSGEERRLIKAIQELTISELLNLPEDVPAF